MHAYNDGSGSSPEGPYQARRDAGREGRLARAALIVGIIAAIATVIGVGWTILNQPNNELAAYQAQVSATCEQVRTVLTTEHNEVLVVGSGGFRVRKDLLLAVMRNNREQAQIAFDALNAKAVPSSLSAQHQAATAAQAAWFATFDGFIATVQDRLRDNARLERLQELGVEMSGGQADATRLTSVMTALAGRNCPVTGPPPTTAT